jgi:hypothetical protein
MVIFAAVWYAKEWMDRACVLVFLDPKVCQKAIPGQIDLLSPSTVVLQEMPAAAKKK